MNLPMDKRRSYVCVSCGRPLTAQMVTEVFVCSKCLVEEIEALTAERDKLKAENEELKSYQRDLCTDIDRLQRNETGMIKEIAERIIKQRQTEAELTAAVKLLGMYCFKGYISLDCDKCFTQSHGAYCPDKIRAALKTVVEKGKEDSEK